MKIILSGGTGLIGQAVVKRLLQEGHELIVLTRSALKAKSFAVSAKVRVVEWDACHEGPWMKQVDGADAVINLTGESIAAARWTAAQKEKILKSRVDSTRILVQAILQAARKPQVLINASAVGYYGNVPEGPVTEGHPKGAGFLAETCEKWEKEAVLADTHGVRVVLLRTGIVLDKSGGAMAKILPPFCFFIGGPLGSGKQGFPWIHHEDEVEAILFALKTPALSGPVNLTAPETVDMAEFCRTLGRVMHRPSWAPVPAFVLKLMLGEMSALLLEGQKAVPEKLIKLGFQFRYPALKAALEQILR